MIAPQERQTNYNLFDHVIDLGELADVADQTEVRGALAEFIEAVRAMDRIWSRLDHIRIVTDIFSYITSADLNWSLNEILNRWEQERLDLYPELRNRIKNIPTGGLTPAEIEKFEKILADLKSTALTDTSEPDKNNISYRNQMIQRVDVIKQMIDQRRFIILDRDQFFNVLNKESNWL